MKKFLLMLTAALLVMSCQIEKELVPDSDFNQSDLAGNKYAISVDDALENLEAFLVDSDNPATRSINRVVSSIKPIKYNVLATKGELDSLDCENLLYVANFEQGDGYAILAADERIGEKVIAVTDDGCLSDATVYSAMELAQEERLIIDGYPLTGPGFFTTPETGDEVFMNPNTVLLYDESMNDTMVGNFSLDDECAVDENGNPLDSLMADVRIKSTPEILTSSLCVSYAINEIKDFNKYEDMKYDDSVDVIGGNGGGSYVSSTSTKTETSAWDVKKSVEPILTKYVSWTQSAPFNDLYPWRRKYLVVGHKRRAPAGCFPLAIAKILTHYKYPDRFTYNGYTVDWNELSKSNMSEKAKKSAAYLLRGISSGCGCLYFYQGTFTFPSSATSYMRFIGLNNAHSHDYSFNRVTGMVDKGRPLIIYSVPGVKLHDSHSWHIDGYKIKERTITTKTYVGNTLKETTTRTETCNMVHCDFGWGGISNGYYISGVFKLNDSRIERDPNSTYDGDKTNYNNLLKVITY
ncbi:MAG: C10 family peptidase [Candidatus Cryptobacteroides sp.]